MMDGKDSSARANVLLAGLCCRGAVHLIIGTNPLAAARCNQSLTAGAQPILVAPEAANLHYGLQGKIDDGSVKWEKKTFENADLFRLGREEVGGVVDAVFVTTGPRDATTDSHHISTICKRNRIPINVVDAPALCTITLLSTYTDGPLQVGVTTNGRGCKLASRIRREIAAALPPNLGAATARLGDARRRIIQQDQQSTAATTTASGGAGGDDDDSTGQDASFNKLVTEENEDVKTRRIRWLSQVCEYWPLSKLAAVTDEDMEKLLANYPGTDPNLASPLSMQQTTNPDGGGGSSSPGPKNLGRLILAGSGPGHPDLLTRATHTAILTADLILADKLVPEGVLALIPRRTPVHIARKFPGNAEQAQAELLTSAHTGVLAGQTVLRLKQGDPFIYGRGGEEVAYFRGKGLGDRVVVLPGITSALSAPLFSAIPPTQRDVADQVLICTGTGKKGKPPVPPEYVSTRTVVFLMALHRIAELVRELTTPTPPQDDGGSNNNNSSGSKRAARTLWPLDTPCAVIERASCPDQRVIRTTLARVTEAIEEHGSRPPGLLVVGGACHALDGPLEKGRAWVVEEGFRGLDGLGGLDPLQAMVATGLSGSTQVAA